jgi:hypothetical protein
VKLLALLLVLPLTANAGTWFEFEAGIGASHSKDMGDGTWIQYSPQTPHSEQLASPAYLAGFTGDYGNFQWHADYIYFGQVRAACLCVPDANYNPKTHTADEKGYIPFNGFGHTQGAALTVGYGFTWRGFRFGAEAGPWAYLATWHVTHNDPAQPGQYSLGHRTVAQLGYVIGARIERGSFSLSYRYYSASQRWNPYPGLVTGTHILMIEKRF